MNSFLSSFKIHLPILQAPMVGVSTPALAAAVSNAGGLGALGIGASTVDEARQMIATTRALTTQPFNVNVFCHQPAKRDAARETAWIDHFKPLFDELGAAPPTQLNEIYTSFVADEAMFRMLLAQRPPVISFHFGLPPLNWIKAFKELGIKTLATATNLDEARRIEKADIDAIVAQGIEAGGHRGIFDPDAEDQKLSTSALVKLLVRETTLPVIAAGGIMNGKDIRTMLDLGASAAQLGTAFILCPESSADKYYRDNLRSAHAATTRLTKVISGRMARGLANRLVEHGEATGAPAPAAYPVAYDLAKQLHRAATAKGNHEFATQWAGQGASSARAMTATDLMAKLMHEMNFEN